MRNFASFRHVTGVNTIPGKDRIVQYVIGGWLCIDKKGAYKVGDLVLYIEPDCWVPHELAPFLSKGKEPSVFKGIEGERLRTIKIGGYISQGLILPHVIDKVDNIDSYLGIVAYEPPITGQKAPMTLGDFPSFIPKTDLERVQNIDLDFNVRKGWIYDISEKLDGQSFTAFFYDGKFGVCSKNYIINLDSPSAFKFTTERYKLEDALRSLKWPVAIQGELIGPGIQGNPYKLKEVDFYVFGVYDIYYQKYLKPSSSRKIALELGLKYVPRIALQIHAYYKNVQGILEFADQQVSRINPKVSAEGLVFKPDSINFNPYSWGFYSEVTEPLPFKVLSNSHMAGKK